MLSIIFKLQCNLFFIITLSALLPNLVSAAERTEMSLGFAANVSPHYVGSNDPEYYLFPVFDTTYHLNQKSRVYVGTINGLGIETRYGAFTFGFDVAYRYGLAGPDLGLTNEDRIELAGMDTKGETATLKPHIKLHFGEWNISAEAEKGIKKENNGLTTKLALNHEFFFSQRLISKSSLHVTWGDDKFNHYYFGVNENEATPERPEYIGEAGMYYYGLSAEIDYLFTEKDVIFTTLTINQLNKDFKDSKIVNDTLQSEFTMGYLHFF